MPKSDERPGARGETYLTVDGEETPVLLTNRALANAERLIGRSILLVLREAGSLSFGINETAILLREGLEQARRDQRTRAQPYRVEDAWRIMDQVGFSQVARAVMGALNTCLSYDPDEEPGLDAEADVEADVEDPGGPPA